MPNPVYKYILKISFLNDLELICLHTRIGIVSTQMIGFNY